MNTRQVALNIIEAVEAGEYSNLKLNQVLRAQQNLNERDKHFVTRIVYGTIERKLTLDWIIQRYTAGKSVKKSLRNILRMGCYQLLYMDGILAHAACKETVDLCKIKPQRGFINAVLRQIERARDTIILPQDNSLKSRSIRYSVPIEVLQYFEKNYNESEIEWIFSGETEINDVIRINRLKTNEPEKVIGQLEGDGCTISKCHFANGLLQVDRLWSNAFLKLYREGIISIQGEGSAMAVEAADIQPNYHVLDLCSAPGGKAAYCAELMGNEGSIIAQDIHEHRVKLIDATMQRLGITCVKAIQGDGMHYNHAYREGFDCVIVDAPCSGLGVIHKKPEIKYRFNSDELKNIYLTQRMLLEAAAQYVKPQGNLIYCTCTIHSEENEKMAQSFKASHPEFEWQSFEGARLKPLLRHPAMIQSFPGRDNIDGFFIAKFRKVQ